MKQVTLMRRFAMAHPAIARISEAQRGAHKHALQAAVEFKIAILNVEVNQPIANGHAEVMCEMPAQACAKVRYPPAIAAERRADAHHAVDAQFLTQRE